VLAVVVTIRGMSICSVNSDCDNNANKGRYICSANSYCDTNGEVYMQ
jgi:hypothetical protein